MSTDRHNRVKNAANNKFTVTHENTAVGDTMLRPDLVLARGEEAVVIDVCCPFDNRPEAPLKAREQKVEKYEPVCRWLLRRYQQVTVSAVVVGALGSWDPANDCILRRFSSRSYLKTIKKLAVSETVACSRNIYAMHVTGK